MAKGNRRKGGNNGRRNNYFEQEIQRNGTNFLDKKNARNLQLDAQRVFRDIARGNIDMMHYAPYFEDELFLQAIINKAHEKLVYHQISHNGILFLIQGYNSSGTPYDVHRHQAVLTDHRLCMEAYQLLFNHFSAFKVEKNPAILVPLVAHLQRYRYNI